MSVMMLFGEEHQEKTKKCVYCNEDKPLSEYAKHKMHYDGLDSRCTPCMKKRLKIVNEIKKTAPPKPETCACCGKKPVIGNGRRKVGLALDHDPVKNVFRGWLCNHCNIGIGLLGDNLEGVMRAVDYLRGLDD